jgi:adenine-specific DNA-methyltransferase
MKPHMLFAALIAGALFAEGGSNMPMLKWAGKDKVVNHHNEVPFRVLERKWGHGAASSPENMIIHGDNLAALKSLLPRYEGKVKCIYIDPPYNTGEEGWVYNDNVNDPQMKKWLGEVVGKEGEDFSRHDKWLCMMYPRLRLLHKLLSDDGTIFISIDDNEFAHLRLICDEIFGGQNFITTFIWEKRVNRENRKVVSSRHDYLLCYAKHIISERRPLKQLPMTGEALDRYQNPDNDPRGPWKSDPVTAQAGHATQSQFYTLKLPNGIEHRPPAGRCWLYTEPVMMAAIADGRIWLGPEGKNTPRKKTFLYEKERGLTPETLWFASDVSTNEKAKNELKLIFPEDIPFATPKPHELIEQILRIATDKDAIVLDSFAGSGTTAHAVLKMNAEDGGNRRFILVEMMDYAETVTAERVKRVIDGYGEGDKAVPGTGGGFGYYELGEPLMIGENLNEELPIENIRDYVWHTETRGMSHTEAQRHGEGCDSLCASASLCDKNDPYLLGVADNVAYYFCYERSKKTTLNRQLLKKLKTKAERYVIYADVCLMDAAELKKMNIAFKKIPRDITRL